MAPAEKMTGKTERIDSIVKSIIEKLDKRAGPTSEEIEDVWRQISGEDAAAHTKTVSLRKRRLVINVDSSSWLYELTLRKEGFLEKFREKFGKEKIDQLQFRIGGIGES